MTTPAAAALTEQEHKRLERVVEEGFPVVTGKAYNDLAAVIESIIADRARLADSRPAVTEAAVTKAAEAICEWYVENVEPQHAHERPEFPCDPCRDEAKTALSAALPHMGGGKADAPEPETNDACRSKNCGHPKRVHNGKFCCATNDKDAPLHCSCPVYRAPFRLSPTGDDSE